jgi:hypothetical protein
MSSIEYRVIEVFTADGAPDKVEAQLNRLGSEGWELIDSYKTDSGRRLIFKRSKN